MIILPRRGDDRGHVNQPGGRGRFELNASQQDKGGRCSTDSAHLSFGTMCVLATLPETALI